jgi:FkbM family methyltransferase
MSIIAKLLIQGSRYVPEFRGKHRILRDAVRMVSWPNEFVVNSGGAYFSIRGEDICEFWMAVRGFHSPAIFNKLCEFSGNSEAVVWDIGANIGTTCLPLLSTKPRIRAVAFEPSPAVCGTLVKNANLNPNLLDRLTIVNCALSETTAWASFYTSGEPFNSGVGGLRSAENRASFPVATYAHKADDLLDVVPSPDIIKMDVEGHELSVLTGMEKLLGKEGLMMIFEHSLYRIREAGHSIDAVPKFLEDRGFTVTTLDGSRLVDLTVDQDIVATK